ncbi:UNVERIFIED_CONTAM: Retrovirus-related Pol polyprotein from transposon RE1 [Sesamum latifolium]|uniref:Retrovirus-related Pol polyprotein from transposon RE1 n=1 Tax=Sesamum latifolium TaxID=2727402 RepID=A0AAW2WD75_9LAMI
MISNSASWVLNAGCGAHICNNLQVLERSRKLSKDEMVLRLGDGKVVVAEAMGSLSLVVSNRIRIDLKDCYFVPRKNDQEALCWTKCDGQQSIGFGPYRRGPLRIPARGGFSYFITFTDDHSRYGYIYLMRYKSEAYGRFKYRLEVENQTNRKIKTLRSDRGGEYLSGEFIDYLKENGILSQWTSPGTPQLNRGYALETAAKLLNIAPSKMVPQTPYKIWHGKPASYKYLRVWGNSAYVKRLVGDKLDSRFSLCSEEPHRDSMTSFEPSVHTDGVPVLCRSTRESRAPERYEFVGLTSQLDNDPKTYGEAMSDIDSEKWLGAMKSKINSMGSNQVTAFKARLVAKGYTQPPGVDFEKTYSPVAMAKSIRILLAIAA